MDLNNKYQESPVEDEIMYYAENDVNVHLLYIIRMWFSSTKNKPCALFWCRSSS